ncbi:methylamine utilization protein MauJ [Trichococcus alkaliphilus]|uniref:methylamine utilization protein MauJ n=1 Tax=Trichococcus alkaliphilus TaxID=2052943 RepID=UPI000D0AEA19|nr:methylamine utilization protein MauJ [Trichococcus alkaliphilus]
MSERTVWEIDFEMIGPITMDRQISFQQEKGFHMNQFYSDIQLSKSPYGINATITAYADNPEDAERIAYVYFGRMRDVLSLNSDVPIRLNIGHGNSVGRKPNIRRRVIRHSEIKTAFNMARTFEKEHKKILRAISWYSKGKLSHNTLDQFLSYWSVIEILANEYHKPTQRTNHGVINKAYQSFLDYFGEIEQWGLPARWINDTYEKRNMIVHGAEDFTIEAIIKYSDEIPLLEGTASRLIKAIIQAHYGGMGIFTEFRR